MSHADRVAAQINMYPMDLRHVEVLLPHQLRVWEPMVDSVVVTIDPHRSRSGRYRGENFDNALKRLRELLASFAQRHPKMSVVEVDLSDAARRAVAQRFFGVEDMPVKAWDGGPFYSYFYGMGQCDARYIVHFDGDMLFGGGSQRWVDEAVGLMQAQPDLLLVSPFPGPPREDGQIFGHEQERGYRFERTDDCGLAYRFRHASTRIFMIDMQRFSQRLGAFPLLAPGWLSRCKARVLGNPPIAREAEAVIGESLRARQLTRLDFVGSPPGLWSLHPPYRSEEFYRRLPEFVRQVEQGQVPDAQRGHYDMNGSMIDWSVQQSAARWDRRYWRLLRDRLSRA